MEIPGKIDRSSPMPFYYQLQEFLAQWIGTQKLLPHASLPSEGELQARFEVSRSVVRQALLQLETEGLIYLEKGRGSFVAPPKLRHQMTTVSSFTDEMRARGAQPGAQVLHQALVPAGEEAAGHLQVEVGSPVFFLERVRLADGMRLALESAYLHFDGDEALVEVDFSSRSLYTTLTEEFHVEYLQSEQELEATLANQHEAELLGLHAGAPVMLVRFTTFDTAMQPVEFVKSIYRGDKFRFHSVLHRDATREI